MIRSLFLVLVLATAAAAQCTQHVGGCTFESLIGCGTAPQIGTGFLVCARPTCSVGRQVMILGTCTAPTPLRGIACAICSNCTLSVQPLVTFQWTGLGCFSISIPRNLSLVGATFCVQNACLYSPPCICTSNSIHVRIVS